MLLAPSVQIIDVFSSFMKRLAECPQPWTSLSLFCVGRYLYIYVSLACIYVWYTLYVSSPWLTYVYDSFWLRLHDRSQRNFRIQWCQCHRQTCNQYMEGDLSMTMEPNSIVWHYFCVVAWLQLYTNRCHLISHNATSHDYLFHVKCFVFYSVSITDCADFVHLYLVAKAERNATFSGSEYISYNFTEKDDMSLQHQTEEIVFDFKTESGDGLLFFTGEFKWEPFISPLSRCSICYMCSLYTCRAMFT